MISDRYRKSIRKRLKKHNFSTIIKMKGKKVNSTYNYHFYSIFCKLFSFSPYYAAMLELPRNTFVYRSTVYRVSDGIKLINTEILKSSAGLNSRILS